MRKKMSFYVTTSCLLLSLLLFFSCSKKPKNQKETIADSPRELQEKTKELLKLFTRNLEGKKGWLPDSTSLSQAGLVKMIYERSDYTSVWCFEQRWLSPADSLFRFIQSARLYGLFPEDYHIRELDSLRKRFFYDSLEKNDRKDAGLWTKAEVLMTDAFMQIITDIKLGRLANDSITLRKDSVLPSEFYSKQFDALHRSVNLNQLVQALEPKQRGYHLLKQAIPKFLDSSDSREYTIVPAPSKNPNGFKKALQKRLYEGGYIAFDSVHADSAQLAEAIKKFQKAKGITVDGKAGEGTIRMLNVSDREKFIRIALSLDKYKMLPDTMPSRYIWVNASANYLEVMEDGKVRISSRVICGKPRTRTPSLTSLISELITYPQWVPPPSIVAKEILPAVKKNPGYLARKGFSLLDSKGNEVDPYTVDWSKYNKGIPFRIVQGSGDANAMGVMKFVFNNKYSVYLHDTNQRYLFNNTMRSLSHGCVRVQEWEKLAYYILGYNSTNSGKGGAGADSLKTWLQRKQKKHIAVRNKMPVYIRYFTCEGNENGVVFYDDVYGEDKLLREKYFTSK